MAGAEGFEPSALGFGVSRQQSPSVDEGRSRTQTVDGSRWKSTGLAVPLAVLRRRMAVSVTGLAPRADPLGERAHPAYDVVKDGACSRADRRRLHAAR